jgi:hypothetical protein
MRRITEILKQLAGPIPSVPAGPHVTIRHARPADADALAVLAQLDSSHPPHGAILVAEAGGELWAAVSLDDSHLIANPFRPTGELAFNLLDRARRLRRAERRQARRSASVWPPPTPLGGSR